MVYFLGLNLRNIFIPHETQGKIAERGQANIKLADRKKAEKCHSSGQDKFMAIVGACTGSVYK